MIVRLFVLFVSLCSISISGQNVTISGNVKDETNTPIAYANVVLLHVENSTFIAGTTTNDDGVFEIEAPKSDNIVLKISFLGFEEYTIIADASGNLDIGSVILKEKAQSLEGITVIAKRPTVKRLVDRLVFNVENSTLSNNNVLDVLKHTPGVLVHDDNITIKNAIPTVYINDRKVHLSISEVQQLLEGTSATNIKSIEVITNPPAKYEAEGGAVLNIVTSKNIIAGYNGSIFGNYKQGSEFPKYAFGTSHFFKTKKLNTYLNYSISPRKDFNYKNESINFIENNQNTTSWETDFERIRETANQNINANIDYEFDDNNSLGFSTNMIISLRDNAKTYSNSTTNVFNASKVLDSLFKTENRLANETFNLAFNLKYIHKFKRAGEELSINAHYTNYDFSGFQNVDSEYFFPNEENSFRDNRFQTFSSQKIKLYTGQIDYELPISDSAQFEAGLKFSNIQSESVLNQFIFENDEKIEDLQNSDIFLYDETTYAAYASYSKKWTKWDFKLGLRTEYTNTIGNSMSTNTISNNDYVKFFPSIHLLNRISDNNEIYFNYNKRIHRPRYKQLNPFRYFINDNTYSTGDPNLLPQIDDQFILGYNFSSDYTFEVYYRNESNPTLEFVYQNNEENVLIYQNTNTENSYSYGIDFMLNKQITPWWDVYFLTSYFYYENKFALINTNNDNLFFTDKWSLYAEFINYFTLLKDKSLTANVSYTYLSPTVEGPTLASTIVGLDINIRKALWNNRASLSIGVTDVFNTQNFSAKTKYANQDSFIDFKRENRLFVLGFNYKFGNFRLNSNKRTIDLKERERLD